jgi:hypothetical protein
MSSSEESGSESHSSEEERVKKPAKPAAKRAAKPVAAISKPPAAAPAPIKDVPIKDVPMLDEAAKLYYTWDEAKKLVGTAELEKLYGKPPGPLPYLVRDSIGNGLCPNAEGQRDFYLPAEDITPEACKEQFEVVASRLPKDSPYARIVEAWLAFAKKKGYIETFKQASDLMSAEIKMVEVARKNPKPTPPPAKAPPIPGDLKRKDISGLLTEAPPAVVVASHPVAKPAAPSAALPVRAAVGALESGDHPIQSIADMRRKMYRKTDANIISPGFAASSVVSSRNGGGNMVNVEARNPIRTRYNSTAVQAINI